MRGCIHAVKIGSPLLSFFFNIPQLPPKRDTCPHFSDAYTRLSKAWLQSQEDRLESRWICAGGPGSQCLAGAEERWNRTPDHRGLMERPQDPVREQIEWGSDRQRREQGGGEVEWGGAGRVPFDQEGAPS